MFGQLDGRGGGDQVRWRISQRAVPAMIMQPMLPLGDLNVARLTVEVAIELVDVVVIEFVVVVGGVVTVSDVDGPVVEKLKLLGVLDVLVTVTVFEPPDPHPVRTSAATAAAPTSRFTLRSLPVRAPGRRSRQGTGAADLGADGVPSRLLTHRPRGVGSTHEHDQRTSRATHP